MVTAQTDGSLLRQRLSSLLLGLIIFFSSTQLGLHFWPLSTLVYGIRIDYLSPTLYFLDLLTMIYLFIHKFENLRIYNLRLLSPLLLTNLLYSQNPLSTLSWSLHFVLYLSFVLSLSPWFRTFGGLPRSKRQFGTFVISVIQFALTLTLLFQTILASTQVFLGHSLGGLMYYLGERNVAVGAPAVAVGSFLGETVLRGYGTFSHPNVLAGYAVISFIIILRLSPWIRTFGGPQRSVGQFGTFVIMLPLLLTTIIVALTQSRSAALTLFIFIIPLKFLKNIKQIVLYMLIVLLSGIWLLTSFSIPRSDLSLAERRTLQGVSLSVIRSFPVFGTGAQASITTYPSVAPGIRLLQPDHDALTLFLSWFGIFGVITTLSLFHSQFEHLRIWDLRFLVPLLPLLLLDHYLITSPQGLFILLMYVAIHVNYPHVQKNL